MTRFYGWVHSVPTHDQHDKSVFYPGQRYQIYHPGARNGPEGPKDFQPLLVGRHFVQHRPRCLQGGFATLFTRAFVILNFVSQAGRLTKEAREIKGSDEKNLGEENARASQLRALRT